MCSFTENAFLAGDESDASGDEWDVGRSDQKASCVKVLDDVAPHATDDLSKLKLAIINGDIGTIEQLLDNGMDVETRLGFEWTPLMCAVDVANYHLANLLLDRGACANFSKDQWTVLMASTTASASEDEVSRCVELLLSRNADPNMADRSQMTCLMLAARDGYSKVINLLVSHGAKVDVQNSNGFTALSIAVQFGREEAVLKLLQLGADKTIKTNAGKSPADLAVLYKRTQIGRILASSSHLSTLQSTSSMEETLSKLFQTSSDRPSPKENVTKLDELQLLLHGLNLGDLADIMAENDISWSYLLTMEKEDLEKIGITNPADQQKVLNAVKQMHLDKVDLDTIGKLGAADSGSEDLLSFLISVNQQCCYLTEMVQDVISRFPSHSSQLVFSLDPKKEAQVMCNQLVVQVKDLQREVTCLRNLITQINQTNDCCQPPQPVSRVSWRMRPLTTVALSAIGATVLMVVCKAASTKVYLWM